MPEMKKCAKCGKKYPPTTEYFHSEPKNKDGLKGTCKECISKYDKVKNTKKYKESMLIKKAEDILSNTKTCSECGETFSRTSEFFPPRKESPDGLRSKCRKCNTKHKRMYNEANKEHIAENHKLYYEDHKESIVNYHNLYYLKNRQYFVKKQSLYQRVNIESYRKYHNKYNKEHPEGRRIQCQRYRAKKRNLLSTLTMEQWKMCKAYFNNCCAYCGKPLKRLEQDHFIALNNGGEYSRSNIIPACRHCNPSKGDRDFFTWYLRQPFYFKEREQKILSYLGYDKNHQQQLALI